MQVRLNDENIKYIGRSLFDSGSLKCEFTDSGFEFKARCKGSVTVGCTLRDTAEQNEDVHFGVMINGDFDNMHDFCVPLSDTSFKAVENLPDGEYVIRIVKLNEFSRNCVSFDYIELDGELLEKPADKPLKFEFYGDSLTCGYGNLAQSRAYPTPFAALEHGYRTYAALLANKFNAELSVIAASGNGILHDFSGGDGLIGGFFDKALPCEGAPWNFENYKADAVFFNIGSNDYSYATNNKVPADSDAMFAEMKRILTVIRRHNPSCRLIFVFGINDSPLISDYINIPEMYERLHAEFDNSYIITNIQCNQLGGDWHPNTDDHMTVFKKILCRFDEQKISF